MAVQVALYDVVGGTRASAGVGEAGIEPIVPVGAGPLIDVQAGEPAAEGGELEHEPSRGRRPLGVEGPVWKLHDPAGLREPHLPGHGGQHRSCALGRVVVGVLVVVQAKDPGTLRITSELPNPAREVGLVEHVGGDDRAARAVRLDHVVELGGPAGIVEGRLRAVVGLVPHRPVPDLGIAVAQSQEGPPVRGDGRQPALGQMRDRALGRVAAARVAERDQRLDVRARCRPDPRVRSAQVGPLVQRRVP